MGAQKVHYDDGGWRSVTACGRSTHSYHIHKPQRTTCLRRAVTCVACQKALAK